MEIAAMAGLMLAGIFVLWTARWSFEEHYLARAVFAAVFGVIILGTTFFYVIPAMTSDGDVKLRDKLALVLKENAALTAVKSSLETDAKRLSADRAAAEARLTELERRRSEELDGLLVDIEDLRAQLVNSTLGVTIDRPVISDRADKADQARALVRGLASFKVKPVAAPVVVAASPDQTKDLTQLRDKMSARLSTPAYDVETYPDRELVRGRPGRYYVVDLKNAASGVRYYFSGGKYVLSASNQDFRASLNTFIGDILAKFEGKVRYELYVRGSADGQPYAGQAEPGYEFRSIKYIRNLGGDKYGMDVGERVITAQVRNEDLPDLRAAFMQKIIADAYPVKTPKILEGTVTAKTNDKDRSAELIMFVDW